MKILNIYGQEAWHTEARIVGNREGLEALRAAINSALLLKSKVTTHDNQEPLFASDGEGYELIIEYHNDGWGLTSSKDNFWNKEESNPQYIMLERQNRIGS